jgi:hypothetical protein
MENIWSVSFYFVHMHADSGHKFKNNSPIYKDDLTWYFNPINENSHSIGDFDGARVPTLTFKCQCTWLNVYIYRHTMSLVSFKNKYTNQVTKESTNNEVHFHSSLVPCLLSSNGKIFLLKKLYRIEFNSFCHSCVFDYAVKIWYWISWFACVIFM